MLTQIWPVRPEEVRVRNMSVVMGLLWPRWVVAVALPWGIYLRRSVAWSDPRSVAAIVAHELVHVRQWRTLGAARFLAVYLTDYFKGRLGGLNHRAAYHAIRLEAEATVTASLV